METKNILLIVDVQKGFINGNTKHIPALVEKLQQGYNKVYVTQFINSGSQFRDVLDYDGMTPGSEAVELAFVPVGSAKIVEKNTYAPDCRRVSYFDHADLLDAPEIHICGLDTDACVLSAALLLFDKGFHPVVLKDCCASSGGKEFHDAAIKILERNIGKDNVRSFEK